EYYCWLHYSGAVFF
nr:immunoglobulin light chain junction region [Macaca mulatta]